MEANIFDTQLGSRDLMLYKNILIRIFAALVKLNYVNEGKKNKQKKTNKKAEIRVCADAQADLSIRCHIGLIGLFPMLNII